MHRRDVVAGLLGSALAVAPAAGQPSGGKRTADVAREIFALNLGNSLGLAADSFTVFPPSGLEDAGYHATLKTGPLLAWTAVDADGRALVNGFAGPGPGIAVAFDGFKGGLTHTGGLSALMEAVHFLDPQRRLSTKEIVERVTFCLNRTDRAEFLFEAQVVRGSGFEPPAVIREPSIRVQNNHVALTYFTMVQGFTGTFGFWKVIVSVVSGYDVIVEREDIGW